MLWQTLNCKICIPYRHSYDQDPEKKMLWKDLPIRPSQVLLKLLSSTYGDQLDSLWNADSLRDHLSR